MALQFTLNNLEGIDDAMKGLYKQVGEVWVLDVAGAESTESIQGLKNALETKTATVNAMKQAEAEAAAAVIVASQEALLASGKHEELAANLTDQLNTLKTGIEKVRQDGLAKDKSAAAMEMATTLGKDANAIGMLKVLLETDMSYSEAGVLQGKGGETITQMLERVNKATTYDALIKGTGAGGADLNPAGGSVHKKLSDMTATEQSILANTDPAKYAELVKNS